MAERAREIERPSPRGYAVVIEGRPGAYGAWVPQLDGCVAVGATRAEVRRLIAGAIELHITGMRADGQRVPRPTGVDATIVPVPRTGARAPAPVRTVHGRQPRRLVPV